MRKTLFFATTAVALAFGAAHAFAMGGGNLSPEQSPYALIAPPTTQFSQMSEGRAAYTGPDAGYSSTYGVQPVAPPEDRNYYSRGR